MAANFYDSMTRGVKVHAADGGLDENKLSIATRGALIGGVSSALWAIILLAIF